MLALVLINIGMIQASTSEGWTLQYLEYAPSTENNYSWTKTVKASSNTISFKTTSVTGVIGVGVYVGGDQLGLTSQSGVTFSKNVTQGNKYKTQAKLNVYSMKGTNRVVGKTIY